jgi:hypothetical protein
VRQKKGFKMTLKGEDVSVALRDWVKLGIIEVGKNSYDSGKFFFGVTVGSMGLIATLQKLDSKFVLSLLNISPYIILFISLLLSLNLVLPRDNEVSGDTDLLKAYNEEIEFIRSRIWFWFFSWLIGTGLGFWNLLTTI